MKVIKYIKDSFIELNTKMTWLPFAEAQKSTVVVAIFTIIFALAVFIVDKGFQSVLGQLFKFI